jgi:hypothetical protein
MDHKEHKEHEATIHFNPACFVFFVIFVVRLSLRLRAFA